MQPISSYVAYTPELSTEQMSLENIPLTFEATDAERASCYHEIEKRLQAGLAGEQDWISILSTVVSELHGCFAYFHWTGFYRHIGNQVLKVGPYQGGHGCLTIPFSRGVCGAAAREQVTQRVDDIDRVSDHIACSTTTKSEIVVPILSQGEVIAVLDIDSDEPAAFRQIDQEGLENIAGMLSKIYQTTLG